MKYLLQFVLNFCILIHYFIGSLFLLFWYGKLIKVSPYHCYTMKHRTPMELSDYMDVDFQMNAQISAKELKTEL